MAAWMVSCGKDGGGDVASINSGENGATGTGGSTARFTISGDYLYTVNSKSLITFDISDLSNPTAVSTTELGIDMETIFPKDNYLYIGSQSGMHIVSISNPAAPKRISTYQHIVSCDPVVANNNYAYVTLRTVSTGRCRRGANQVEVIDISNPANPQFVSAYSQVVSPRGLGIDPNMNLYVCDQGLMHFDATDANQLKLLQTYQMEDPWDVIPVGNILMVTAEDGIYQYDKSGSTLNLLSKIKVE